MPQSANHRFFRIFCGHCSAYESCREAPKKRTTSRKHWKNAMETMVKWTTKACKLTAFRHTFLLKRITRLHEACQLVRHCACQAIMGEFIPLNSLRFFKGRFLGASLMKCCFLSWLNLYQPVEKTFLKSVFSRCHLDFLIFRSIFLEIRSFLVCFHPKAADFRRFCPILGAPVPLRGWLRVSMSSDNGRLHLVENTDLFQSAIFAISCQCML